MSSNSIAHGEASNKSSRTPPNDLECGTTTEPESGPHSPRPEPDTDKHTEDGFLSGASDSWPYGRYISTGDAESNSTPPPQGPDTIASGVARRSAERGLSEDPHPYGTIGEPTTPAEQ